MNENLASKISQSDVDLNYFVNIILKEKQIREDIVELTLNHPHIMVYYNGYYILDKATEVNPKIFYKYWEDFVKLLKHRNTYLRQIGIVILSNLTKVDKDNKFSEIVDDYLKCLYDKKILIGVYTVRYLKGIIKNEPEYRGKIIDELLHHREKTSYKEKQEALLDFDILEIFEDNYDKIENKEKIIAFIINKQKSISPKTKKKSKEIIKKLGIK
jgi:hypothetical protein